jgi:hypothetical protein
VICDRCQSVPLSKQRYAPSQCQRNRASVPSVTKSLVRTVSYTSFGIDRRRHCLTPRDCCVALIDTVRNTIA